MEQVSLQSEEYLRSAESVREEYRDYALSIGCVGYEPFVSVNGQVTGQLYTATRAVMEELGIRTETRRCSWGDFSRSLETGKIDVMADPIMPSNARPFYVVPYAMIPYSILLYDVRHEQTIRVVRKQVREVVETTKVQSSQRLGSIQSSLYMLNDIGLGLAVTSGVVDLDLLHLLCVSVNQIDDSPDIVANAVDSAKKDHVVILDYPSALSALDELNRNGDRRFRARPLLPDFASVRIAAGIAVRAMDSDLQRVFLTHVVDSDGIIRRAVENLPKEDLEKLKIEVLSAEMIPNKPIMFGLAELWPFKIIGSALLVSDPTNGDNRELDLHFPKEKQSGLARPQNATDESMNVKIIAKIEKKRKLFWILLSSGYTTCSLVLVGAVFFYVFGEAVGVTSEKSAFVSYILACLGVETGLLTWLLHKYAGWRFVGKHSHGQ